VVSIDGYRDGIMKMVESLQRQTEASQDNLKIQKQKKDPWLFPPETKSSTDYVVEWSSLKRKAQGLIDSGEYSGEKLETLKKFVNGGIELNRESDESESSK
jgi:hypothetical protein